MVASCTWKFSCRARITNSENCAVGRRVHCIVCFSFSNFSTRNLRCDACKANQRVQITRNEICLMARWKCHSAEHSYHIPLTSIPSVSTVGYLLLLIQLNLVILDANFALIFASAAQCAQHTNSIYIIWRYCVHA